MKFTRGDYTVFSGGAVIIIVFSLLFYFDFTSRSARGQERSVGSIIFKKQVAQRKYASQVIWEDVEKRMPVYNNDSIRTSVQSEAVIRLNDGTEITLNENSMILLSMAEDAIDIQFKGGSISTKRDEAKKGELGALNIRSGESTVSLENTDLQVASGKEKELSVTVSRGSARVSAGGAMQDVRQSQKALITGGGKEIRMENVALIPLSPKPDSIFITPEQDTVVRFSWGPLEAGVGGVLEVSAGTTFAALAALKKLEGQGTAISLKPGTYYWRMKARGGADRKPVTGDMRKFTILREAPAYQVFPAEGQEFQHLGRNPTINFKWNGSESVQIYRLDIASDPSMEKVIASYDTQGSSIAVDALGAGTFYWQVTSIISAGGETFRIKGKVRSLAVAKTMKVTPPRPVFPQNGEIMNAAIIKGRGMVFSWDKMEDLQSFRISVSRSADFRNIVFDGASTTNFINFRGTMEQGTYYWRVMGILAGNRRSDPSETMRFTVTEGKNIRLVAPENKELLAPEPGTSIRFAWEQADLYGEYQLQIAPDRLFGTLKKEARVNEPYAYIAGLTPGTYHWRVVMKNADGQIVLKSEPGSFIVQDIIAEPVILSPRNGTVFDFKNINELDLSWKRLKDANLYRIKFYRMENNRAVFIAEREIGNAPLEIDDINFLGEGKILWSIQAFETREKGKKIVRKSRISRAYFEVRIPKEAKKIKFLTPKVLYTE